MPNRKNGDQTQPGQMSIDEINKKLKNRNLSAKDKQKLRAAKKDIQKNAEKQREQSKQSKQSEGNS